MYLEGTLWLMSWPVFILLALYLSKYFIKRYEAGDK
jgi:hypothetical protein